MTTNRGIKHALVGITLALAASAVAPRARAQTPDELQAARQLFQEAYDDEQAQRYAEALDKFQRVAKVKSTPAVRYRIASVLESLGRLRESRDAFRALAAEKPQLEPKDQDIADSAATRAASLDKRIPRLVLKLSGPPPADERVTVDGAPVPASTEPRAIELDPGEHVVQASAPGARPFESKVTLGESGEVAFTVPVESATPLPAQPPPDTSARPNKTLAYVALGAGGVLLVTSAVLLIVRENDISDLNDACPGGACPIGRQSELQGDHDQAQLFGPLGVGLGIVGLAAAGAGAYLLLRPSHATSPPTTGAPPPTPSPQASLRIGPRVVRGGAILGLGGTF